MVDTHSTHLDLGGEPNSSQHGPLLLGTLNQDNNSETVTKKKVSIKRKPKETAGHLKDFKPTNLEGLSMNQTKATDAAVKTADAVVKTADAVVKTADAVVKTADSETNAPKSALPQPLEKKDAINDIMMLANSGAIIQMGKLDTVPHAVENVTAHRNPPPMDQTANDLDDLPVIEEEVQSRTNSPQLKRYDDAPLPSVLEGPPSRSPVVAHANTPSSPDFIFVKPSRSSPKAADFTAPSGSNPHVLKYKELMRIRRLESRGFQASRRFSILDSYEELVAERMRLSEESDLKSGIEFQKSGMLMVANIIEMANGYYDPFSFNLTGWSDSLNDSADSFEPVFEELYDKYKENIQVAPELKLLGMFFFSAMSFHFSHQLLKKAESAMPGFANVMQNNPQLKKQYTKAATGMFVNNVMSSGKPKKKDNDSDDDDDNTGGGGLNSMFGMLGNLMGSGAPARPARPTGHATVQKTSPKAKDGPSLREPSGLEDILKTANLSSEMSLRVEDEIESRITNDATRNANVSSAKRVVKK